MDKLCNLYIYIELRYILRLLSLDVYAYPTFRGCFSRGIAGVEANIGLSRPVHLCVLISRFYPWSLAWRYKAGTLHTTVALSREQLLCVLLNQYL
jgi:hypothetical protein